MRRKRFVVVANWTTQEQDKLFQDWLSSVGLGWWHWLMETWLIVDQTGGFTVDQIRDKATELFGSTYLVVFEFSAFGDTWAGFGPKSDDPSKNMFTWLKENWN